MWKRDQAVKPEPETSPSAAPSPAATQATATPAAAPKPQPSSPIGTSSIGRSVIIKGELSGTEDLTIEGKVEGSVELRGNKLTVGPDGQVQANISARAVVVLGKVTGDITATEKVSILENGSVEGDLAAPSIAIADGAHFRGSVDMQRQGTSSAQGKANGQAKSGPGPVAVAH